MKLSAYLQPGQMHVTNQPTVVSTVLGSCVAVCLWDAGAGVGGVNHYLLPDGVSEKTAPLRYAGPAIEGLIRRVIALGADARRLEAKVFGGASVISSIRQDTPLGLRNVATGLNVLKSHGIPVTASKTGGDRGMKVEFHTDSGEARVKTL